MILSPPSIMFQASRPPRNFKEKPLLEDSPLSRKEQRKQRQASNKENLQTSRSRAMTRPSEPNLAGDSYTSTQRNKSPDSNSSTRTQIHQPLATMQTSSVGTKGKQVQFQLPYSSPIEHTKQEKAPQDLAAVGELKSPHFIAGPHNEPISSRLTDPKLKEEKEALKADVNRANATLNVENLQKDLLFRAVYLYKKERGLLITTRLSQGELECLRKEYGMKDI
jgi:hypothetical protein